MTDNSELVTHYLEELRKGDSENAYFSLIEANPAVIPCLQQAAREETDSSIKATLVEIIWQHRLPESVDFLAEMLADNDDDVWKAALDGLVTVKSTKVIENALADPNLDSRRREWFKEALEQAKER